MATRYRNPGADLWRPLIRLTEAITMLDMAGPEGKEFAKALWPIREQLLEVAKAPRRSQRVHAKGDPT